MSDEMEEYVGKFVDAMRNSPDPILRMAFPDTKECSKKDAEEFGRKIDSLQRPVFEKAINSAKELARQAEHRSR